MSPFRRWFQVMPWFVSLFLLFALSRQTMRLIIIKDNHPKPNYSCCHCVQQKSWREVAKTQKEFWFNPDCRLVASLPRRKIKSHATWFPGICILFETWDRPRIFLCTQGNQKCLGKRNSFSLLRITLKGSSFERRISLYYPAVGQICPPLSANILWYVLMNHRAFDVRQLRTYCSAHRPAPLERSSVRDAVKIFPLDLISIVITWQEEH